MQSYQQQQARLFSQLESSAVQGKAVSTLIEPVENFATDKRRCLTSVVFLPRSLSNKIASELQLPLKQADANHYYYSPDNLHLTIKNVRVVADPPDFTSRQISIVRQAFADIIPSIKKFSFDLNGLLLLPTSISIRGFCDDVLFSLISKLDTALREGGMSDDKRYASDKVFFGNISICRYNGRPNSELLAVAQRLRETKLGELEVVDICLVTGNAVLDAASLTIVEQYKLS